MIHNTTCSRRKEREMKDKGEKGSGRRDGKGIKKRERKEGRGDREETFQVSRLHVAAMTVIRKENFQKVQS